MTGKSVALRWVAAFALLLTFSCAAPQPQPTGIAQREAPPVATQTQPTGVAQQEPAAPAAQQEITIVSRPEPTPASAPKKPVDVPPTGPAPAKIAPPKTVKPSTVAVWDFDSLSVGASTAPELGEVLASRVTDAISRKGKYTVVERQRLLLALEELHLGSSALADESTRLRLGKMVGARMMIFGGYLVSGDKMRLDVRLVNVETGALIKAAERTLPAANIPQWLEAAESAANELL
ncbi:MAG: CsgG/HfaB family protein [Syntrophobacteraceae bacterium]